MKSFLLVAFFPNLLKQSLTIIIQIRNWLFLVIFFFHLQKPLNRYGLQISSGSVLNDGEVLAVY